MERMLTGRPIHTDGTLDVSTLAVEAGVSRQDLYRTYRPILEEFRSHLCRLDVAGSGDNRHNERVTRLTRQRDEALERAARYRSERDAARRERDVNASQVCHLAEQTRALRDQLDAEQKVTSIRPS